VEEKSVDQLKVNWRKSFAVRFAAVLSIVLGAAVGVSGWLSYRDTRHQLVGALQDRVSQDAGVIEIRLETWFETLGQDTRSISQSPVLDEFLKTRGTIDERRWRGLVEESFRAVFAGKPTYTQMRLLEIGGPGEGREIVRLDRRDGLVVVTPGDQLQEKGGRDYFKEATKMPGEGVYLSEINLNREFGRLTDPQLPTVRSAIGIGPEGGPRVMLIINADMRLLFSELRNLASPDANIYLSDGKGDFLMNPNEEAVFASDLGHDVTVNKGHWRGEIYATREVSTRLWPGRQLDLRVALADETWRPVLEKAGVRGLWTTVLAVLGGAIVALVIAWFFSRRLGRLTKALRRFDGRDDGVVIMSDPRRDEIGVAIRRFEEMATKVRQHVEELHRARESAEEAEAAKEHFLAVMSHEIRTPMNAVVGLVRALEANDPTPRQKPILASLQSSTSNLMTLLNTALDYTRLHEGAVRYEVSEFDAAELAREVTDALKPLAMSKNLKMVVEIPGVLRVRGDAVRLRQVLNNLLNNALKFTEEGFVKLVLKYARGTLEGTVSDSGPGIAGSECDDIFEPFYSRGDGSGGGAGLGLSVSREMIEQQKGTLTLECPPDGGAVFRFCLPYELADDQSKKEATAAGDGGGFGKGRKILYVEDTISNQEVMEFTLDGTGFEMSYAGTGAEAMELSRSESFDLIMLDLQLPDITGTALARKLREEMPGVPMVLVTAQVSAAHDGRAQEAGIGSVLLKPYTKEAVLTILKRSLEPDFSSELKSVHPGSPEKAARLAKSMAKEFREAAAELTSAHSAQIEEVSAKQRHRLTAALSCFPLPKVEAAFDRLGTRKSDSQNEVAELVDSLNAAAEVLERSLPVQGA